MFSAAATNCTLCTACNRYFLLVANMVAVTHATFLLLVIPFLNPLQFSVGSDVQGDCSKDGSCEAEQEKHGKEKYTVKGEGRRFPTVLK